MNSTVNSTNLIFNTGDLTLFSRHFHYTCPNTSFTRHSTTSHASSFSSSITLTTMSNFNATILPTPTHTVTGGEPVFPTLEANVAKHIYKPKGFSVAVGVGSTTGALCLFSLVLFIIYRRYQKKVQKENQQNKDSSNVFDDGSFTNLHSAIETYYTNSPKKDKKPTIVEV